jgi:hypothetical protein
MLLVSFFVFMLLVVLLIDGGFHLRPADGTGDSSPRAKH